MLKNLFSLFLFGSFYCYSFSQDVILKHCIEPPSIEHHDLKQYNLKGKVRSVRKGFITMKGNEVVDDSLYSFQALIFDKNGFLIEKYHQNTIEKDNWTTIIRDAKNRIIERKNYSLKSNYIYELDDLKTIIDTTIQLFKYSYEKNYLIEDQYILITGDSISLHNTSQYKINKKGCVLEEINSRLNKPKNYQNKHQYDKKGRRVYSYWGDREVKNQYEKGRIKQILVLKGGKLSTANHYEYLPNETIKEVSTNSNTKGKGEISEVQFYEKNGSVHGYAVSCEDTIKNWTIVKGDTTLKIIEYPEGRRGLGSKLTHYKEETITFPGTKDIKEFRKYRNHELVEEIIYEKDGSNSHVTFRELMGKKQRLEKKLTYTNDEFGNWVLSDEEIFVDDKLSGRTVHKRIIEYYD